MSSLQPSDCGEEGGEMPVALDLSKVKHGMYRDIHLPYIDTPPEIQVLNVKDMDIRDTDVLLCSYPKSGTHWLFRVLDMLVTGRAEYSSRIADHTSLDLQQIHRIGNLPSPRVLMTHFPLHLLPDQVKAAKIKVIHVYRCPKAVMNSLFFQLRFVQPDLTFEKLEQMLLSEMGPYRNQFYYLDKVKEFQQNYPDVRFYNVAYEDMKKDPVGSIQKLAAFLQTDTSDQLCSQIAEAVTFSRQKEEEEKNSDEVHLKVNFYRKGQSSDWKNHLTVAISERIDQLLANRAHSCPFSARYVPSN